MTSNNNNVNPLASSLTILSPNHSSNLTGNNITGVFYNWGEKFSQKPIFNSIVPNVRNITSGFSHTLALTEDSEVYSWGDNRSYQLGVGNGSNQSTVPLQVGKTIFSGLKVKAIACGGCFSAVILENGLLYTWGILTEGSKYTEIPTKVDLLKGVTSVSVGINHVAVVAETTTGEKRAVFTWGSNKKGQLGVQGDSITNAPRRVTLGPKAISVSCGEEFTAAIVEGNEVFIWGNNKNRQICNNTDETIYIPVKPFLGRDIVELSSSRTFVVGRSSNGDVCVWGNNENVVRAGDSDKWLSFPSKIRQVAAGLNHVLALTERGEIYSWGAGEDGQLGHDEKKSSPQFKLIASLIGRNVLSICAWGRCSGAIVEPGNFRVEISECMRKPENQSSPAPLFIRKLVNYLRGDNSKVEGIFRLNGSIARLDELEKKLDQNEKFTISKFEPYDAADIIKRYFKTLPEPLLTNALCQQYEKLLVNMNDESQRHTVIMEWIGKLPIENRNALIYILGFLDEIAHSQIKHQKNNAMSENNLALVFAPNLLTRGEIGNDGIIDDMIRLLPVILKSYPELEPQMIVDQANECLKGSRTSYIIDHWTRIKKERPNTAKQAFFNHQVVNSIVNSIVNGLLQMKSSRSNSLSNGTQSPNNPMSISSPNISPESSPAPRVTGQSMSFNNLIYNNNNGGGSSGNSLNGSPMHVSAGINSSSSNINFMINRQVSSPVLGAIAFPSLTLHSSNSQLNLTEQNKYYEQILSLVLSPIIPVKSIIKVLPSIFEISQANDLFIKLLLLNQFEHTVSENLADQIQSEITSLKEINKDNIKEKLSQISKNMENIVHNVFYLNSSIEYWQREQVNITLYSNQIQSYFKWWGEFLDKSFKETEEKVMRFKKDFDKIENDKSKLEKQYQKLTESIQKINATTTKSDQLKLEFDQWTLLNQLDVLEKKLDYTNQQMLKFQQEKINIQIIYEQFKPHQTLIEDFVKTSVNQSLASYLEKLQSSKSTIQTIFPQIFSQFTDIIFLHLQVISLDSQSKEQLLSTLDSLSNLMFKEKIPQKYILSLELETKFNSLKKNVTITK